MLTHIHHVIGRPWAITPEVAELVQQLLAAEGFAALRRGRALHAAWDHDDPEVAAGRGRGRQAGAIAVVPLFGLITQRGDVIDSMETASSAGFAETVLAYAADTSVQAIVLEVDSPGGEVFGIPEAAAAIRAARGSKPVVASANSIAGSAAYWLAAQADEVIVTPSGEVGSIGVYAAHQDVSKGLELAGVKVTLIHAGKFKVEGNPYEALGDEARGAIQADVDRYYDMFVRDVAKGRGAAVESVRSGFGEGRMLGAKAAVEAGMATSVGTLDDAIRRAARLSTERRENPPAATSIVDHLDFTGQAASAPAAAAAPEAAGGAASDADLRRRKARLAGSR